MLKSDVNQLTSAVTYEQPAVSSEIFPRATATSLFVAARFFSCERFLHKFLHTQKYVTREIPHVGGGRGRDLIVVSFFFL